MCHSGKEMPIASISLLQPSTIGAFVEKIRPSDLDPFGGFHSNSALSTCTGGNGRNSKPSWKVKIRGMITQLGLQK